jgi:hypothetical protein
VRTQGLLKYALKYKKGNLGAATDWVFQDGEHYLGSHLELFDD